MATNEPFEPSMIFRSRTTKASSNVTEQKAKSRSLLSSMSLMRTSVITTVCLLCVCGQSKATPNQENLQPLIRPVAQGTGELDRLGMVAAQGEQRAAAAAHQSACRLEVLQSDS